jgi:ABC-type enterochelin transport system permease subunit
MLEITINEELKISPPRFQVIAYESTQKITILNNAHTFSMNFLKNYQKLLLKVQTIVKLQSMSSLKQ